MIRSVVRSTSRLGYLNGSAVSVRLVVHGHHRCSAAEEVSRG